MNRLDRLEAHSVYILRQAYKHAAPVVSEAATIEDIMAELETNRAPERAGRPVDSESEDLFEQLRTSDYM